MRKLIFLLIFVFILVAIVSCHGVDPQAGPQVEIEFAYYDQFDPDGDGVSTDVEVIYKIMNTGPVTIDYYKVFIVLTFADSSVSSFWSKGFDRPILPGKYGTNVIDFDTDRKEVVKMEEITDYLLETYWWAL